MSNKEAIGRYWKRACEKLYVLQILGLYGALGMMSFPSPFTAPLRVPGPAGTLVQTTNCPRVSGHARLQCSRCTNGHCLCIGVCFRRAAFLLLMISGQNSYGSRSICNLKIGFLKKNLLDISLLVQMNMWNSWNYQSQRLFSVQLSFCCIYVGFAAWTCTDNARFLVK